MLTLKIQAAQGIFNNCGARKIKVAPHNFFLLHGDIDYYPGLSNMAATIVCLNFENVFYQQAALWGTQVLYRFCVFVKNPCIWNEMWF